MSKIPVRVKVKAGLTSSATKKRFDLDDYGNMIRMENHICDVKKWNEQTKSVRLRSNINKCTYVFDVKDVVDIDTEILPSIPKPEIFNIDKLNI